MSIQDSARSALSSPGPLPAQAPVASSPAVAAGLAREPGFRQALQDVVADEAETRWDEPMFRHTTLRIGGPADIWVAPRSIACLCRLLALCHARGVPFCVLGAGSNLLVRDGGIRGVVVSSDGLRGLRFEPGPEDLPGSMRVFVEAGVSTGKLLSEATRRQLGGVEFLGGVPGSVGGGLVMNAGTYVGEFKDVTTHVQSVRPDGSLVLRSHAECGFVYRGSALPRDEVIVEGRLLLRPRPRAEIEADVRALRERRRAREPHGFPNAGSFFKNPPGDFAGRLIEAAGLKGTRIGSAEVAQAHANWILNVASRGTDSGADPTGDSSDPAADDAPRRGGGRSQVPGSARDTLQLIEHVRSTVLARFGVALELEVRLLGEDAE